MNWISIKDKTPESGQQVLTCYDVDGDYFYETLTYFLEGDTLDDEMPHSERIALAKTKAGMDRLMTALFAARERPAPETGFYFIDTDENGLCVWRKHRDISHWAELVPPNENKGAGK